MPDASSLPPLPTLLLALVVATIGLGLALASIRRVAWGREIVRVPLAARHELRLDEAGPIVLHGEGPRSTRRFAGLIIHLVDRMSGARVDGRRPWVRTTVAGGSRVRLALMRFDVPKPGVYGLEVGGLTPAPGDDACALVVTPAAGPALSLAIVATLAAGAAAIATIVGIALRVESGDHLEIWTPAVSEPPMEAAIDTPTAPMPTGPVTLPSAGRQLPADPDAASALTTEAHWQGGGLTLRLPTSFEVRATGNDLDVRDPNRISTFLVGHSVVFPAPTTAAILVVAALTNATERVRSGALEGYALVRFGGVAGMLTIESRRDGGNRLAIWSAYRPTESGVRNTTVIFGAETAEFDRLEATARAIFASARFD